MINNSWAPTTPEVAARRAGGRRRYNRDRQEAAFLRRYQVLDLLMQYGSERGAQSRVAEQLGVHRSTISRDVQEQWKNADRWEKAQWKQP